MIDIRHGDSCSLAYPDDHFDCLVTDPPYGYGFMGKDWDKAVVPTGTWKEVLRVMKPGAFGFVMSAPRQDVLARMIVNLQDAGFETGFTSIYWAYATGFPKAMNISKAVDKRLGAEREVVGDDPEAARRSKNRFVGVLNGGRVSEENCRPVPLTAPASPPAKSLDGSYAGFQPKPAVEVILVVMKPLSEKSYLDQAMKDGKGVTWLEAGRIPIEGDAGVWGSSNEGCKPTFCDSESVHEYRSQQHPQGRFPANLLVSDDVLDDGRVTKSSGGKSGHDGAYSGGWKEAHYGDAKPGLGDTGTFSRYFSLDAWWEALPESVRKTFPFLIVPKASKAEKNRGCEGMAEKVKQTFGDYQGTPDHAPKINVKSKNHHPTVKPLRLMSYLIAIGSRPGDLILDPFMGSGTTLVAAKAMGRRAVGVDNDPECIQVTEARVKAVERGLF